MRIDAATVSRNATLEGRGRQPAAQSPTTDPVVLMLLLAGFTALYVPSYLMLAQKVWPSDEQGHGPIILAISLWLIWSKRHEMARIPPRPSVALGLPTLAAGLLLYVLGRSQFINFLEIFSQVLVLAGLLLLFVGRHALRQTWFPLFFMLFMVPLPGSVVAWVTAPLKLAVSAVASEALFHLGYPVGRSGVMLNIGPYQLMVADACAGLNSMFTLEALGLLYMNLMRYSQFYRNLLLSLLIVPIAFCANIVRVMVLVLVTYHWGDEAGQGFIHGFAGMVLFAVGLSLMLATDTLLRCGFRGKAAAS